MDTPLSGLEPARVWYFFQALNAVPRPSKREERVTRFMIEFGEGRNLETEWDAAGNVLIRKPASPGMEDRPVVVLQAHLDMVHQKNASTKFDFETEGIRMYADGDWVRANGTTLGADNGLGVAAIMAVLDSDNLAHPALEALFTVDEETGMTGAKSLSRDWLKGRLLLNLDTEEDDELGVGCAGGVDVTATGSYGPEETAPDVLGYRLEISGLQGGHSGMDIHKGLGNANKILGRLLYAGRSAGPVGIHSLSGGNLRNAIPREAGAVLALDPAVAEGILRAVKSEIGDLYKEYSDVDPELDISLTPCERPATRMPAQVGERFLRCLEGLHNGVETMSRQFPGRTETSNNVARVEVMDGRLEIGCLCRSSRESAKRALVRRLEAVLSLGGLQCRTDGDYPGWQPDAGSGLLQLVKSRYRALFAEDPKIEAGHGGLECGILKGHYPDMDMISFGPTIRGAHSPDERASVTSTKKFWTLLCDVLGQFPAASE